MNYGMKAALTFAAAALAGACGGDGGGATNPAGSAHVRFATDAPFCSDPLPVNYFIDGVQVGRDTLWFGVGHDTVPAPGPPAFASFKESSQSFSVQAGDHTLRAAIVDTMAPFPPFVYNWPDTTVSVAAGAEFVRKLPFYCS